MKNVVIISSSLRKNSNSQTLAEAFEKGAREAGNRVTFISLADKTIGFCKGCMVCQTTGSCCIKDDAVEIERQVLNADVVVFATPIYYYEMSGQMKTLLDRMNALYPKEYRFRDVYMLSVAMDDDEQTPKRAESGLQGWVVCFEKAQLKGTLFCGGVNEPKDIEGNVKLQQAYEMGKKV